MGEANWVWQGMQGAWPRVAMALAAAAFFAVVFSYRQASTHAGRRIAGFLCKVAAFALLLVLLLEPTSVTQTPKKGENDVLLLADNSASLALKPNGAATPGDALTASWKDAADHGWVHRLQETFRVHVFSFDERLHEQADLSTMEFKGMRSVLGGSLESLVQRYEKQPVAAMVLFTDGNATDATKLDALLAGKPKAPIYPVVMGLSEAPRDIALQGVEVTQTPFEDSPVAMTARVSANGFGGEEVSLVIKDEAGKTVHTEKHRFGKDETAHTFQARFRPALIRLAGKRSPRAFAGSLQGRPRPA